MGDCKDQKPADHPFPGRQTFREIIQIIAQKSPLLQEMYFQFVWFDWVKNVSRPSFMDDPFLIILVISVSNQRLSQQLEKNELHQLQSAQQGWSSRAKNLLRNRQISAQSGRDSSGLL